MGVISRCCSNLILFITMLTVNSMVTISLLYMLFSTQSITADDAKNLFFIEMGFFVAVLIYAAIKREIDIFCSRQEILQIDDNNSIEPFVTQHDNIL